MIANINFTIKLPYLTTEFEILKDLGVSKYQGGSVWAWTFPLQHFDRVQEVISKKIEFLPAQAETIKSFAPPKTEDIIVDKWKGKDKIKIVELPTCFKIITHRKQEDGKPKEATHFINKETVKLIWKVIKRQPLNKKIKSSTVWKNIVEEMGINRFHRESNSFDESKFFGNRQAYHQYFYWGVKVLSDYLVVRHYKAGFVERLSEEWNMQGTVEVSIQDEVE